jgi:hypothetical protein
MSLVISKVFTYDTDAGDYIQRVEGASGDNAALEPATRQAINNFVIGCKQDGIWSAIKASCILSGARTLNGALQPLAGTAPTNNNFVTGDYNRKTGLVGDGTTKRLNANRLGTADPQDSKHAVVFATTATTSAAGVFPIYIGTPSAPSTNIFREPSNGNLGFRCGTTTADTSATGGSTGLIGVNRSLSASFVLRSSQVNQTFTRTSAAVASSQNFFLYGNDANANCNARLAFYSIGESLDLALLDARVTALITAFGVAIP